ncbi:MAG: DUF2817 domain-containing protein [Hyphomicrobiales bacterium]
MIQTALMPDVSSFETDYRSSRELFLEWARRRGATLRAYRNPNRGPSGEELVTDVAWVGEADADRVLVTISATHGVEGFCGSGCQVDWLRYLPDPPKGVAVLHVHALNPHGFAWLRRVTEEGVDLNRNHVDFDKPIPQNPGYTELADALIPEALEGAPYDAALAKLSAYEAKHGTRALRRAQTGGQYTDRKGLFYGGDAPTWSRRTNEAVMADFDIKRRSLVCLVDYHTGLGPYGYGEAMVSDEVGTRPETYASAWFGESLTNTALGNTSSDALFGFVEDGWKALLGDRAVCITLEYGCFDYSVTWGSLVREQWHHLHRHNAAWDDPETVAVKTYLRRAFHPDTPSWKELVLFRSRQILGQATAGLAAA